MFPPCFGASERKKILSLTAVILAGGQSRRMGTDKARLEINGLPLLERVAAAALSAGLPLLVIGRVRPTDWSFASAVFAEDALPGHGPLGGLHTALTLANGPVLALACDLPRLSAEAVRWLASQASERIGEHGLVTINTRRWEPLFSCYAPACLPLIETRLAEGRLSLHGLIESGDFSTAEAPDWLGPQLLNLNTPEDLREHF